jgi:hypothetical protein
MSAPTPLSEAFERWGRWWLPEAPEEVFGGVARYEPGEGVQLSLGGGFNTSIFDEPAPGVRTFSAEQRELQVIHGRASGRATTMLNCFAKHSRTFDLFGGSPDDQVIAVQTMLVGCHLESPSDQVFVSAEVALENLSEFAGRAGISGTMHFRTNGGTPPSPLAEVRLDEVPELEAQTSGKRITLLHHQSVSPLRMQRSDFSLEVRDTPVLHIDFDEPVGVDEVLATVGVLQDLITLSTMEPSRVIWLRTFVAGEHNDLPDEHPHKTRPAPVECIVRYASVPVPESNAPATSSCLFSLRDTDFTSLIPNWFEVHSQFRAAINMILGLRSGASQYLETSVITSVSAAETFHRSLGPSTAFPARVHRDLRKRARGAVDEQHQQWVAERLADNSPTLHTRLISLAARLDPELVSALMPNVDSWAHTAKSARNKLAHTGQADSHGIAELYAVAEVTAAVVVLNLVEALGITAEALLPKFATNNILRHASELAREHFQVGAPE